MLPHEQYFKHSLQRCFQLRLEFCPFLNSKLSLTLFQMKNFKDFQTESVFRQLQK